MLKLYIFRFMKGFHEFKEYNLNEEDIENTIGMMNHVLSDIKGLTESEKFIASYYILGGCSVKRNKVVEYGEADFIVTCEDKTFFVEAKTMNDGVRLQQFLWGIKKHRENLYEIVFIDKNELKLHIDKYNKRFLK